MDTSLSLEQLKGCDIWSYGMVMFMLLNPDLQFPYQVEIDKLHPTTYEMCKREVTNLLTSKQFSTFSDKFSHFQATSWLMLECIFEKCAEFYPTKRPTAPILVEMFSQKEDPVCRNIPLAVSQSTSVEQHDQLVADGAIPMSNVVSGDATNSCSFLSVLIAGRILEERRDDDLPSINSALDERQFFCENVNDLILTMPDHFNRYRDINRMYDVHEAYTILHKANIIKESYELFEEIIASSKVFTKKRKVQCLSSSGRCIVLLMASRWMETQRLRARFRRLKPYFDGRITWSRFPQRQPCPLSAGVYLFAVADDICVNCVNEA